MDTLYDSTGEVNVWIDDEREWIIDQQGRYVGLIKGDRVYDFRGVHRAWWRHDHVRGHDGTVLLALRGAKLNGASVPAYRMTPPKPVRRPKPSKPALHEPEPRKLDKQKWGNTAAFLNKLTMNGLGFHKLEGEKLTPQRATGEQLEWQQSETDKVHRAIPELPFKERLEIIRHVMSVQAHSELELKAPS